MGGGFHATEGNKEYEEESARAKFSRFRGDRTIADFGRVVRSARPAKRDPREPPHLLTIQE